MGSEAAAPIPIPAPGGAGAAPRLSRGLELGGKEARTRLRAGTVWHRVAPCPQRCGTASGLQRARGTPGMPSRWHPAGSSPFLLPGTSRTPAVPSGCGSGSRARRVPAFICEWGSVHCRQPRLKGASVPSGVEGSRREAAPELWLCFPESSEPALHALPSQEGHGGRIARGNSGLRSPMVLGSSPPLDAEMEREPGAGVSPEPPAQLHRREGNRFFLPPPGCPCLREERSQARHFPPGTEGFCIQGADPAQSPRSARNSEFLAPGTSPALRCFGRGGFAVQERGN